MVSLSLERFHARSYFAQTSVPQLWLVWEAFCWRSSISWWWISLSKMQVSDHRRWTDFYVRKYLHNFFALQSSYLFLHWMVVWYFCRTCLCLPLNCKKTWLSFFLNFTSGIRTLNQTVDGNLVAELIRQYQEPSATLWFSQLIALQKRPRSQWSRTLFFCLNNQPVWLIHAERNSIKVGRRACLNLPQFTAPLTSRSRVFFFVHSQPKGATYVYYPHRDRRIYAPRLIP